MKLKDVPYYEWILYNGKPYHVRDRYGEEIILRDSAKNDIWSSIYEDVELIDVPVFKVGDTVLYQGRSTRLYGQVLLIRQYDGSSYSPYCLTGSVWATPFEITKIDY